MDAFVDPLELIARSDKAARTKDQYARALGPYLEAGGELTDVDALLEYAEDLCSSRRVCLRAALRLWADATRLAIIADMDPLETTPARIATVQAMLLRLETIPDQIKVEEVKGQRTHTWLSPRQVRALAAACDAATVDGLRDKVALGLLVGAGLRRAELAALQWDQIKFQPCGDRMRTVLEVHGKGAKWRTVPISDPLAALLDRWSAHTGHEGRVVRSLGRARVLGTSISTTAIADLVARRGAEIGVPELRPHDLRRTFAQIGYASGTPLTQLSVLLGHASVASTQIYLNLALDLSTTASDFVPFA